MASRMNFFDGKWAVLARLCIQRVSEVRGCFQSDYCVFNGPLGRSLCYFACTAHSAHPSFTPQHSALLPLLRSLAPFMSSLTDFAHSLVNENQFLKSYDTSKKCNSFRGHDKCYCIFLDQGKKSW